MKYLFKTTTFNVVKTRLTGQPLFYTTIISLCLLGLVISSYHLGGNISPYAFGWTTPSTTPPGGNITPQSQWTTSGSNIYYNLGNVGIGTITPSSKLEVAGVGTDYGKITASTDGDYATLKASGCGTNKGGVVELWSSQGSKASPTKTLSGDAIGIITTVGRKDTATQQSSRIQFTAESDWSDTAWPTAIDFRTAPTVGPWDASSIRMKILSNGNVGIGTTTPSNKFQVASASGSSLNTSFTTNDFAVGSAGSDIKFEFGAASGNTYSRISAFSAGEGAWNNLILQSGGGYVGIGTTTPGYKLDVAGPVNIVNGYSGPTAETGFRLKLSDNGGINNDVGIGVSGALGGESLWLNSVPNGDIKFMFGTTGEKVTFKSSGYVGIGTTGPGALLNVNGNALFGGTATGSIGSVQITTGGASPISNRLTYGTDGSGWKFAIGKNQGGTVTDQLTIQDNGNVGIGTTTPGYKLDVSGDVRLSGNLIATANTLDSCAWTTYTCNANQTCTAPQIVAGVERYTTGALCGTAPTQWYQMRLYCCNI